MLDMVGFGYRFVVLYLHFELQEILNQVLIIEILVSILSHPNDQMIRMSFYSSSWKVDYTAEYWEKNYFM